ncbi:lipoprotein signal peptidase [Bacteroidota bacterium]
MMKKKLIIPILIILIIIIADQISKILVKTNLMLGQELTVIGQWFRIHFTENNGMAFGLELAGNYGKLILTLFRFAAIIGIGYYIFDLAKKDAPRGLLISISLILAGAIGNLLDSAFYGMIFNESYYRVATIFPESGGYATILHGRVVDWLYFPVIDTYLPSWFPFWPNRHFIFFRPVFNIADSSITSGVILILLFQKKYFKEMN